jgi:hypothetical protein
MGLEQKDLRKHVNDFAQNAQNPQHRYVSWDYCYNYFKKNHGGYLKNNMFLSCGVIASYLASWGMYRGSSFLLKEKSSAHFKKLVEYLSNLDKSDWEIDVDKYDGANIERILKIYGEVKECVIDDGHRGITLVTKILLGVFAFVPAFDKYFCNTFGEIFDDCGFRSVNEKSLNCIKSFYDNNKSVVDELSKNYKTLDFETGNKTDICYTKAKIIDMFGFQYGKDGEEDSI